MCRGGHIPHTGFIKAVKLLNVAGAYWRGDENRQQLTRLYGITFPKAKELKEHLHMLEEAKKRDHRKLGKELGLFTFSQKVGIIGAHDLGTGLHIKTGDSGQGTAQVEADELVIEGSANAGINILSGKLCSFTVFKSLKVIKKLESPSIFITDFF